MSRRAASAFLLLALCLGGASAISMKSTTFTMIEKACYQKDSQGRGYALGQSGPAGPSGLSMENFISLIEKIELSIERANWSPQVVAGLILSRFHIDEFNYDSTYNVFRQESDVKYRNRIREHLLDATSIHPSDFPEDSLTEDEKCSMYFMLSHHVNKTAQKGDKRVYSSTVRLSPASSRGQLPTARNVQLTENPREFGVVSHRNNKEHAIAPSRVLFGIVASFSSISSARVADLLKLTASLSDTELRDIKKQDAEVDTLLAVTLGDVWAFGSAPQWDIEKGAQKFGAYGKWNSTLCQVEYVLNSNHSRGSLAEIRGGIDGYLLGLTAKKVIEGDQARFKLSTLLRMYYSPAGLYDEQTTVCNRNRISSLINANLKNNVKSYMYAFIPISQGQALSENQINDFVETTQADWDSALKRALQSVSDDQDWCDSARNSVSSYGNSNNQQCETMSDVVVMIDLEEEITQQMDLVNRITNGLDMRKYASSMTIVANTRGGGYDYHTEGLSRIAWNSSNRGCVNCRLAWADRSNFGMQLGKQADVLLNNINTTLRDLKLEKNNLPAVPGKPFLFFNYGFAKKPTSDTKRYNEARSNLKTNHRDVPLILIGKGNKDDLEEIAYSDDDVFESDSPDQAQLAVNILNRICQTPAVFQFPDCATRTSSSDTYIGFVSQGRKQYWAMYPEYFLKSFSVSFEFLAVSGPIKVCYRRGNPRPEEDDRNCKTVKPGEDAVVFRSKNPCHKYGLSDCNPFYFTVIGVKDGTTSVNNMCKEEGCLSMEQIKWSVSHTGISCNSAAKLVSSLFLPITLIFAYFATRSTNQSF